MQSIPQTTQCLNTAPPASAQALLSANTVSDGKLSMRLPELDSLRALGALSVMFSHHLIIYPIFLHDTHAQGLNLINFLKYTPMHFFFNGYALMLFFVMSGFVLMLPFAHGKGDTYAGFAIKRVFRIYPAYIAAIAAAVVCSVMLQPLQNFPELSPIVNATWRHPLWPQCIARHVTMVFPAFYTRAYDPVIWSLVHEMRISLAFPLIVMFVLRTSWKWSLLAILGVAFTSAHVEYLFSKWPTNDYGETYRYIALFIAGALMAKHAPAIKEAYGNLNLAARVVFASLALSIFCYPYLFWRNYLPHGAVIDDYVASLGSCMLLVLALGSPVFIRFLRHPLFIFLGTISYSIYLWHTIIMLVAINLLHDCLPMLLICLSSITTTILISVASYKFIEAPFMDIGRIIAKAVKERSTSGAV